MTDLLVRRILAPVELGEVKEPELDYAVKLAAQMRAELLLLAVIDTPTTVSLIGRHKALDKVVGDRRPADLTGDRDFEEQLSGADELDFESQVRSQSQTRGRGGRGRRLR